MLDSMKYLDISDIFLEVFPPKYDEKDENEELYMEFWERKHSVTNWCWLSTFSVNIFTNFYISWILFRKEGEENEENDENGYFGRWGANI